MFNMKMLKKYFFLFATLCYTSSLWASDPAAEQFLQSLGDQVVAIVNDDSLSEQKIHSDLRTLLESAFAINAMGKFSLGKYWRVASDKEKENFLELFRLNVVHNYINRFEEYTDEKFVVTGSRNEKNGRVIVTSELIRASGQPLQLTWDIYKSGGSYKVYDVLVDGISMSITLRSEYASVIQREGGSIAKLNKAMEAKWRSRTD